MNFAPLLFSSLARLRGGQLRLILPDGTVRVFGGLGRQPYAEIRVLRPEFFRKCVLGGPIGFGEAWMDGDWETGDLPAVIAWFIHNADAGAAVGGKDWRVGVAEFIHRMAHLLRPNSLRTSRRNIAEHYDLGNDFFKLWLDPTMTYSCAWWDPDDGDLQAAQLRKYDRLCRMLRIGPTDHVLEIGSGWGGFAIHAASTRGCRVTTITISPAQFEEARARVEAAGLTRQVEILLTDYRDLRGHYDRIVSIEMLEAVGDGYLETYFAACQRLLKPHGLLGLQYITCPDARYEELRRGVDFIQRYVFPGSLLLSIARINDALRRTGDLFLHDLRDMGPFYARTLQKWRANFHAARGEVLALGYDETFLRKWDYYLAYCEAAFATRFISVVQAVYTRERNPTLDQRP